MKITDRLLRPKWKHPDASVRLKAITEDAIGMTACYALAVGDPDATVRNQAINKLESVEDLLDVLRAQPVAQEAVGTRLTTLLLQAPVATVGPHLSQALAAIEGATDLAKLASQAADSKIRVAAVAIVPILATLRRCALEDKAIEVRVRAVERIDA